MVVSYIPQIRLNGGDGIRIYINIDMVVFVEFDLLSGDNLKYEQYMAKEVKWPRKRRVTSMNW